MAREQELFTTVTTEGGLLPLDLLARVVAGDAELGGLRPEDYGLPPTMRIGEMASRSWSLLLGAWSSFAPLLQERPGEALTGPTRERWLQVLFGELGFGRLFPSRPVELDHRSYPVFAVWGDGAKVPLHLVGAGVDLDHRSPGVAGAARSSPHSLVQELLNAWDEAGWGVVTNGRRLRLLRDNRSLVRQAYVEFDLEGMFTDGVYSDFVLLWSLLHESRFRAPRPSDCWLESWMEAAERQGTRALDRLRDGVKAAIEALGAGFLAHPDNGALRERLRSGELSTSDYYRLVLRLVYRLLFLLVAEARGLLLDPEAPVAARERYQRFYSMERLRRLAERHRGGLHGDLWEGLRVVMAALDERGLPALSLPAYGSMLWAPEATGVLGQSRLGNLWLLGAVRALSVLRAENGPARGVDYKNLGAEELGSVYESLLELHPQLNADAATFALKEVGGSERKQTGSYYTPTELITSLLDTALDPVLEEAVRKPEPEREEAILALKVVDPACGSGHFLLAAAQRIARRLAAVRTGDEEPSPAELRRAVRDVIGHCLYAVDVNPMAVELCKVSLWIEALVPARPLDFLDHRILCGHSLVGTTPRLLAEGIPDDAYRPIEGDEKPVVASWRRLNRQQRAGQQELPFERKAAELQRSLAAAVAEVERPDGESVGDMRRRERRYRALVESAEMRRMRLAADAWCAAFVAPKRLGEPGMTDDVRRRLAEDPDSVPAALRERVEELAEQYHFFHWHLGFPGVFRLPGPGERAENEETGWSGGFDVVLGNPPWERVKLQEQEFFAVLAPEIAKLPGARRKRRIAELRREDPALDGAYREALRQSEGVSHFLRSSGRFPLCGRGDVNTYSVFAETMRMLPGPRGQAGIIVPTGIATDDTTKDFFASLVEGRNLRSLFDFENREQLFQDVDSRMKFCLLTMTGRTRPVRAGDFFFFAHRAADLGDPGRRFELTADDFRLFNPNTKTCPIFRTRRDAEITRRIYERLPVLIDRGMGEAGNPWGISFMRMFDMTNDSGLFRTRAQLEPEGFTLRGNVFERGADRYLPLYEGKMFGLFDHRAAHVVTSATAVIRQSQPLEFTLADHLDPTCLPIPRFWVNGRAVAEKLLGGCAWLLPWRNVTSSSNERTLVASLIPPTAVGHSAQILFTSPPQPLLITLLDAFGFDFVVRLKLGGNNLTFSTVEQLPVLPPAAFAAEAPWHSGWTVERWLAPRAAELCCTAVDMQPLAEELGFPIAPYRWDDVRREFIRAELDAAFFHLNGLPREDVDYVMDTFPIVRRKEEATHGEYRTKRLILERYDAMAQAIATGTPYQTILDPPPADPRVAHSYRSSVEVAT